MKPSITFLAKVRDGKVMWRRDWSKRNGERLVFVGGEVSAKKHADAGLIVMPYSPRARFGMPARAILTDDGAKILSQS